MSPRCDATCNSRQRAPTPILKPLILKEYGTEMGKGSGKQLVVQYSLKPNYGPHFVNLAEIA